jgi:alanine-glyoxylate transaminase/serine-glyoxylate transaminase/serine-pyruvate transaminase
MLCVGPRALARSYEISSRRFFLDWRPVIEQSRAGYFPYTPATLHLFGLREALRMLFEETLEGVYARHARLAEAVRRAVPAWGLEILCADPAERSNSLTAVLVPEDFDSDRVLRASETTTWRSAQA